MITAIVLIKADVSRIPQVAEAVAAIEGVSEVYSVTGRIDLVAMVRVKEHEQLSDVVAEELRSVDGILDTETHIAYRAYSQLDLEATFDLGLD
jgi:DNA-binding Lrp family transcriptional regulator